MEAKDLKKEIDCHICDATGNDPVQIECEECGGEKVVLKETNDGDIKEAMCNECGGSGVVQTDCRRCDGTERINRYGPADLSGKYDDVVVLTERISQSTGALHVQTMPISDKKIGGFNERFGDSVVADVNSDPIANYPQDMRDQLQNSLGSNANNGTYDMPQTETFDGVEFSNTAFHDDKWPDPDLSIEEVIEWMKGRNDIVGHDIFIQISKEQR